MSRALQNLQTKLDQTSKPRERVKLMNDMAFEVRDNDPAMLQELSQEAIELAQESHYLLGEGYAYAHLGYYHSLLGDREPAQSALEHAQKIMQQVDDGQGLALTHLYFGFLHYGMGEINEALDEVAQSMKYTQGPTSLVRAWCLYLLGIFYNNLKDPEKALQYLNQAKPIFDHHENEHGQGRILNGMAQVYLAKGKLEEAQKHGMLSLKIHRSSGYAIGVARSMHDLGVIALTEKAYDDARYYLTKSLEIRRDSQNYAGTISALVDLGNVAFAAGNLEESITYAEEALDLAKAKDAKARMDPIIRLLVQCYTALGKMDEAMALYESLFTLGSANATHEARSRIAEVEKRFQAEKRKQEAEIYRLKNVALKKAHVEIQDSMHYARRMQQVFLPNPERLARYFPKSFAWFQPREVLSGDFYWLARDPQYYWFAVADGTGRGVPSVMLSSVVIHALHFLLSEENKDQPAEILQSLHEILYTQFNKEKGGKLADHVDIALCRFQPESKELLVSAASLTPILIRNGQMEEMRAVRRTLGDSPTPVDCNTHTTTVGSGDRLYLVTDGISNQFGGPDGKQKLMKKGLREFIQNMQEEPMEAQQKLLAKQFRAWRGVQRQIDDICAVGLEFE